jgi:hypothetical protein
MHPWTILILGVSPLPFLPELRPGLSALKSGSIGRDFRARAARSRD